METVCVVSAVVAFGGLMTDVKALGSARTVTFELFDTLRRELLSEALVSLRLRRDSDGRVESEGGTATGGKARVRSEIAEWDVLDVGVGEGS